MSGLLLGVGCGAPGRGPTVPSNPQAAAPVDDPSCPLLVPDTTVLVEETQAGPSFVFLTTGDVEAVRARGEALAAMHNDRNGPASALGMAISGTSSAVAADIDGGVRVTYRPADPNDAGKLGDEMRMHGGHLAGATSCVR